MGSLRQYSYTAIYMCHFLIGSETRTLSVLNGSSLNHSGYLQSCELTYYFHFLHLPKHIEILFFIKICPAMNANGT